MKPIHVFRAINVQRGFHLHAKPFVRVVVVRLAMVDFFRKVRQGDLDMQKAGKRVRDRHVRDSFLPRGQTTRQHGSKPTKKGHQRHDFQRAVFDFFFRSQQ